MRNTGIYYRMLLISIVTGVILLVLFSTLYYVKYKQEKLLIDEYHVQFNKEVNSLFSFKTATLRQVAYDYTYWTDFVEKIKTNDTAWFNNNITTILKSYHIDYVCVFDSSLNIVHEASSARFGKGNFISKEALIKLKKTRFLDFFMNFSDGVIEISGASIHPDNDPSHTLTKPSGYLFLATNWDKPFLQDLTVLSGAVSYRLMSPSSFSDIDKYSISTIQKLPGWNDLPVAQIIFTRTMNSYKLNNQMSAYMLLTILGSVLTTLLLFHFATRRLINKPLKLVTNILKTNNQNDIEELQQCAGEFKYIGFLFSEFFKQKVELIIAKEKAEGSDRLKSAFLANMSHEIRTPMNGILGFTNLLKEPDLSGERQQEYIHIIEKSGDRMLNVINDIINISKIESGNVDVIISEANINEQIESVYSFFKPQLEGKSIRFLFSNGLPENEAIIRTDDLKVNSILTNLVKNAMINCTKGSIEFGYTRKGKTLEFYVKDTGIGIAKDRQEAIFERFIKADISNKMARQGAGLGLAIAKAYVEILGGKIWVESDEGIGSTFYFTIPYIVEPAERKTTGIAVAAQDEKNLTRKLKILIAEDDETSEMLISIIVKEFSKEYIKARTGKEAVEMSRSNPDLDLILMDIQMSDLNGYEAARQIRQFNKDVVIIAQTAYGLTWDREKAIEAGCNDYISKPVNINELLALIQKHCMKRGGEEI